MIKCATALNSSRPGVGVVVDLNGAFSIIFICRETNPGLVERFNGHGPRPDSPEKYT